MHNVLGRGLRQEAHGERIVVFACAASAGAHAGLIPAHLQSEPRLGAAFVVAVVLLVSAVLATAWRPGDRRVTIGVAALLGGLMLAYVASRTTAIPVLDPEREALDAVGVATTVVEAIGLAFALWLAQPLGRLRRPSHLQEVSR
jgi:apolipoprotein N-acyltransferase